MSAHCADCLRQEKIIFTGGEDGLVRAWRVPGAEPADTPMTEDSKVIKGKKHKETSENSNKRFKPY